MPCQPCFTDDIGSKHNALYSLLKQIPFCHYCNILTTFQFLPHNQLTIRTRAPLFSQQCGRIHACRNVLEVDPHNAQDPGIDSGQKDKTSICLKTFGVLQWCHYRLVRCHLLYPITGVSQTPEVIKIYKAKGLSWCNFSCMYDTILHVSIIPCSSVHRLHSTQWYVGSGPLCCTSYRIY